MNILVFILVPFFMGAMSVFNTQEVYSNSVLFEGKSPDHVLKNKKILKDECQNRFDILKRVVNPNVLNFIEQNNGGTADKVKRMLNLLAAKMVLVIENDSPLLHQDNLEPNTGNAELDFFIKSTNKSVETVLHLFPKPRDVEAYYREYFDANGINDRNFFAAAGELGAMASERLYINNGRVTTEDSAKQQVPNKIIFFETLRKEIVGTGATDYQK